MSARSANCHSSGNRKDGPVLRSVLQVLRSRPLPRLPAIYFEPRFRVNLPEGAASRAASILAFTQSAAFFARWAEMSVMRNSHGEAANATGEALRRLFRLETQNMPQRCGRGPGAVTGAAAGPDAKLLLHSSLKTTSCSSTARQSLSQGKQ